MSDEKKARRILFLHISDEMTDPDARRSVLRIAQALAEARAEERARSEKLVKALSAIIVRGPEDDDSGVRSIEIAIKALAVYFAKDAG